MTLVWPKKNARVPKVVAVARRLKNQDISGCEF
jgi:hypothetical protein